MSVDKNIRISFRNLIFTEVCPEVADKYGLKNGQSIDNRNLFNAVVAAHLAAVSKPDEEAEDGALELF